MSDDKLAKEIEKVNSDKELTKEQKDRRIEVLKLQATADEENATRTGVGTRQFVGQTRGKGALVVKWEAFDESKPETLPKSLKEFTEVSGIKSEADLLGFVIDGFNNSQYTAASDPIAEFVNPSWDDATKAQFRLVVRNMSKILGKSIEETATMVRSQMQASA